MADLNTLTLFATVVDANSFSEAARRLQLPVSTLSRRIQDLERSMGVRLLDRSTRQLRPTDFGREVLELAQRGASLAASVDALVSDRTSTVGGVIRLTTVPSLSDNLLAPLIEKFQSVYPEVQVQVLVSDRPIDLVSERMDLSFRIGPLKDSSLIARKIVSYRHLLVASPAYLKEHGEPAEPSDLSDHPILTFFHGRPSVSWTLHHLDGRARDVTVSPRYQINDFTGLLPILLNGGGIGEMPPVVCPDTIRSGQLVEIMPAWRRAPLDLSVVHAGARPATRAVRLFIDHAAEQIPELLRDLAI